MKIIYMILIFASIPIKEQLLFKQVFNFELFGFASIPIKEQLLFTQTDEIYDCVHKLQFL